MKLIIFFLNTDMLKNSGETERGVLESIRLAVSGKVAALLICFCLSAAGVSYAAEISLNASVAPEKGSVGQPLLYTLTISGIDPAALMITLPEKKVVYPDKNIEDKSKKKKSDDGEKSSEEFVPLYIINSATRDDSDANGTGQINIKILLSYYRPGSYTLPEIKINGTKGAVLGYKLPVVTIEEINKEGKFEEIEPPVSLSGNYTRIIWIIAALLIIAIAAFGIYSYLKKRKKPAPVEEPSLPPIEIFLNEVEALMLRELIKKGKINEYVFDISIIFRRYLSSMLNFDAAEMTTDEIASKIKRYMSGEMYSICGDEIISNMRLWDFSKFAEFAPSAELLLENLDATISVARRISGISQQTEKTETDRSENGTSGL